MEPPPEDTEPSIDPRIPTVLLACASFFELISASLVCGQSRYSCGSLNAYAVSVGAVSLALVAPVGLVLFAEPLAPRRLPEGLPHLSLMLLVWWLPAGFLLTFVGPFQGLSNGYFGTLAGVAGALLLARAYVPAFDQAVMTLTAMAREAPSERTALVALALTSTAMWVQAAISVGQVNEHVAVKAWAIIVGVVSFVICVFYLLLEHAPSHRVGFALLLAAWWSQGVALSFVPSHFVMTLNGFASTWASVFLTVYFLRSNGVSRDLMPLPSAPPEDDGIGGPTTSYHSAVDTIDASYDGAAPTWTLKQQPMPPPLPPGSLSRLPPEGFRHTGGHMTMEDS